MCAFVHLCMCACVACVVCVCVGEYMCACVCVACMVCVCVCGVHLSVLVLCMIGSTRVY